MLKLPTPVVTVKLISRNGHLVHSDRYGKKNRRTMAVRLFEEQWLDVHG